MCQGCARGCWSLPDTSSVMCDKTGDFLMFADPSSVILQKHIDFLEFFTNSVPSVRLDEKLWLFSQNSEFCIRGKFLFLICPYLLASSSTYKKIPPMSASAFHRRDFLFYKVLINTLAKTTDATVTVVNPPINKGVSN